MYENLIISTAYLAPIQYYSKLIFFKNVSVEVYEHYEKQSYRTRCIIAGANGPLSLQIPIEKRKSNHTLIRDVRIAYYEDWRRLHIRSIVSAYQTSPFFEYIWDDFLNVYNKHWDFLFDFNMKMYEVIENILQIDVPLCFTESYQKELQTSTFDARNLICPQDKEGGNDNNFKCKEYYQVFAQKFGFIPNLSIIDLIFNMGNESRIVLKNCWKE